MTIEKIIINDIQAQLHELKLFFFYVETQIQVDEFSWINRKPKQIANNLCVLFFADVKEAKQSPFIDITIFEIKWLQNKGKTTVEKVK